MQWTSSRRTDRTTALAAVNDDDIVVNDNFVTAEDQLNAYKVFLEPATPLAVEIRLWVSFQDCCNSKLSNKTQERMNIDTIRVRFS